MGQKLTLKNGAEVEVVPTSSELDACTGCGLEVHVPKAAPGQEYELPQPGELSLCLGCGTISIFQEDLKLRPATDAELEDILKRKGPRDQTGAAAFVQLERRRG